MIRGKWSGPNEKFKIQPQKIKNWKDDEFIFYTSYDGRKLKLNYSFYKDAEKYSGHDAASKIKVPTIIVQGDADNVVLAEQSIKTSTLIRNASMSSVTASISLYCACILNTDTRNFRQLHF